jgi:hypothetical protein
MEGVQIINFNDLKKTDKKARKTTKQKANQQEETIPTTSEPNPVTVPTEPQPEPAPSITIQEFKHPFTYEQMLERITETLNSTLKAPLQKFSVRPPELVKLQGKRTQCTNFVAICE